MVQGEIDRHKVSIPIVADFLLHLVTEKNLSVSAVKGYRSALAPVLRLHGVDISTSPEISSLLKSLELDVPSTLRLVPRWDVTLVLRYLQRAPFEPLDQASLRLVTLKTVLLLALASSKRASEIHGLSYIVSNKRDWSGATLSFLPEFVAKTQDPARPETAPRPFEIPALSEILDFSDRDRLLCPVRALREYLKRTAGYRPACRGLFVSTNRLNPRNVSKNTISFWIREVIKSAYAGVDDDLVRSCRLVPHETRAIATSLIFSKNISLGPLMNAASWRCNTTFASHYLRDTSHQYMDVRSIGPIVAAQQIV